MPRFPIVEWQAEQLRLTCFTGPGAPVDVAVPWWEQIGGSAPENQSVKPRRGSFEQSGPFGGGTLTLRVEPGRIDWLLMAVVGEEMPAPFPNVGSFPESAMIFRRAAESWLAREDVPVITRMAFGAVLLHPETDRLAAHRQLQDYLASVRLNLDASDFLYQINTPVRSRTLHDALINRLAKWSAATWHYVTMSTSGIAVDSPSVTCRVELDISSPAEGTNLAHELRQPLFNELFEYATAIAENGEPQ